MATEIERKFLVTDDSWRAGADGRMYRQGYLSTEAARTVRVRIAGNAAMLTIKGVTRGISRSEFEYAIPMEDATALLDQLCQRPLIEKTRYSLTFAGKLWVIDEFTGDNQGLLVAEVELADENEQVKLPDWVGEEVSDDARYYNANLVHNPYSNWRS